MIERKNSERKTPSMSYLKWHTIRDEWGQKCNSYAKGLRILEMFGSNYIWRGSFTFASDWICNCSKCIHSVHYLLPKTPCMTCIIFLNACNFLNIFNSQLDMRICIYRSKSRPNDCLTRVIHDRHCTSAFSLP